MIQSPETDLEKAQQSFKHASIRRRSLIEIKDDIVKGESYKQILSRLWGVFALCFILITLLIYYFQVEGNELKQNVSQLKETGLVGTCEYNFVLESNISCTYFKAKTECVQVIQEKAVREICENIPASFTCQCPMLFTFAGLKETKVLTDKKYDVKPGVYTKKDQDKFDMTEVEALSQFNVDAKSLCNVPECNRFDCMTGDQNCCGLKLEGYSVYANCEKDMCLATSKEKFVCMYEPATNLYYGASIEMLENYATADTSFGMTMVVFFGVVTAFFMFLSAYWKYQFHYTK